MPFECLPVLEKNHYVKQCEKYNTQLSKCTSSQSACQVTLGTNTLADKSISNELVHGKYSSLSGNECAPSFDTCNTNGVSNDIVNCSEEGTQSLDHDTVSHDTNTVEDIRVCRPNASVHGKDPNVSDNECVPSLNTNDVSNTNVNCLEEGTQSLDYDTVLHCTNTAEDTDMSNTSVHGKDSNVSGNECVPSSNTNDVSNANPNCLEEGILSLDCDTVQTLVENTNDIYYDVNDGSSVVLLQSPVSQTQGDQTGTVSQDETTKNVSESLDNNMVYQSFSYVEELTKNGDLWRSYEVLRVPSDGHCLMHAVYCAYNLTYPLKSPITLYQVKEAIINECLTNLDKYLHVVEDFDIDTMKDELFNYIDDKEYDSDVGDMIIVIISNALKLNIIIVDSQVDSQTVTAIPESQVHPESIIIKRRIDHYDAIYPKMRVDPIRPL